MIQAIIKKGKVLGEEVPAPVLDEHAVLVETVFSAISAGTEMATVTMTGKSLFARAKEQPEQVRKVLQSIKDEGFAKTFSKVQGKLEGGSATGYSLAGRVIAVGSRVQGFQCGDRVACAGSGIANHAEYVVVPENLTMRMPDELAFREASTVTLGGIALQGVRRADVRMGEYVAVIGMGILGQLALQMLKASGCRVLVSDVDEKRLELARELGADMTVNPLSCDPVHQGKVFSGGYGVDVVLFTAATSSSEPLSQSFKMCRRKGRVVLVGVSGMEIKREDMYKNELDFLISTSYGPGRYDDEYEKRGLDYPYAYVRWTEKRNMEEYLRLLAEKKINLEPLIEGEYPLSEVEQAFQSLNEGTTKPLIVLLHYPDKKGEEPENLLVLKPKTTKKKGELNVAVVGIGGFAKGMHLPNLAGMKGKFRIYALMSRNGFETTATAKQFGASYATTDYEKILADPDVDLVLLCTRHNTHAKMGLKALRAGKHLFVEKPLCTTPEELAEFEAFYASEPEKTKPILFVGFNRRFSPHAVAIRKALAGRKTPLLIHYRMNAGHIPYDHWVHSEEGGGRIIGEGCHLIDLFSALVGSPAKSVSVNALHAKSDAALPSDNQVITISYEDGSVATLEYYTVGSPLLPKEYGEFHFDGKSIILNDYKELTGYGVGLSAKSYQSPHKGQAEELEVLHRHITGKQAGFPIPLASLFETTRITFEADKIIRSPLYSCEKPEAP